MSNYYDKAHLTCLPWSIHFPILLISSFGSSFTHYCFCQDRIHFELDFFGVLFTFFLYLLLGLWIHSSLFLGYFLLYFLDLVCWCGFPEIWSSNIVSGTSFTLFFCFTLFVYFGIWSLSFCFFMGHLICFSTLLFYLLSYSPF